MSADSQSVAAINLKQLAQLCGCAVEDLARAHNPAHGSAVGVLTSPRAVVRFDNASRAVDGSPGLDTALISLGSRPGVLDSLQLPKCLVPLASEPVLSHVLRQLHLGGIRRVVIVIGASGELIKVSAPFSLQEHASEARVHGQGGPTCMSAQGRPTCCNR